MNSNTIKNLKTLFALAVVALVLTSCNRGSGCPYEMEAATNILGNILK